MVVTYTTADAVARLLQTDPFGTTTTPTTSQVETIINRKEDRIDQKLMHGWREKTSKEMFINASFIDMRNGVRFDLPDYTIKTLLNGTDILEVWDGSDYVDFLADKTEGRDEDYWMDQDKGVLYIKSGVQRTTKKPIKIKYRFGETTVSGEIEDLCTMLACIDILNMYERNLRWAEDGGSNMNPNRDRISVWKQEIKELYNSLSNIGTF